MEMYFFILLQSGGERERERERERESKEYISTRHIEASYPVVKEHQVLTVGDQLVRILLMENQVCLVREVIS